MSLCLSLSYMHLGNTRYNRVLEAVITYTDELAYKQAKEADEMLARGIYLGTSFLYFFS